MFIQLKAPVYVQWEVTPACNFKCIHCYNAWRQEERQEHEKIDLYSVIVDELIQNRVFHVTITGGEPLLVFKEIKPYLKRLNAANIAMSINTNATLVTKKLAQELREVGITHTLVSVPCGQAEICDDITKHQNSLMKIMRGISFLLQNDITVSVNMVITQKNIKYIYETAKKFEHIPISSFGATRAATPCEYEQFNQFRISREQMAQMFEALIQIENDLKIRTTSFEFYPYCSFMSENHFKKFGNRICSAGRTEVAVSYNGDIKPCAHIGKTYGNIKESLKAAWFSMDEEWRQEQNIPKVCEKCFYRESCSGGCRQEAFKCFGSYGAIDPIASPVCLYRKYNDRRISLDAPFELNQHLQFREEGEEIILIYKNVQSWLLVKKDLIEWIRKKRCIEKWEMAAELGLNSIEVSQILIKLISKGVLVRKNE